MTSDAGRRRSRILAIYMARCADHRCMLARQREPGLVVIEIRRLPGRRRMALRTILGKAARHVIRIRRLLIIRQMATDAGCRRPRISPAHVARRADHRRVLPRQRKLRLVVIEIRRLPGRCCVALRAIL